MSEALSTTAAAADRADSLRRTANFDYLLHIVGILLSLGTLSVVALVINYLRRPGARGTIYESHFTWQIRTFWWTLFWVVLTALPFAVLSVISFGLFAFLFAIPFVWFLYRMIKGLLWLSDGKPMPV